MELKLSNFVWSRNMIFQWYTEEDGLMINMTTVLIRVHQQAKGSYTLGPLKNSTSISGHHQMMFQPQHIHA
jgi:hypothetical protein